MYNKKIIDEAIKRANEHQKRMAHEEATIESSSRIKETKDTGALASFASIAISFLGFYFNFIELKLVCLVIGTLMSYICIRNNAIFSGVISMQFNFATFMVVYTNLRGEILLNSWRLS